MYIIAGEELVSRNPAVQRGGQADNGVRALACTYVERFGGQQAIDSDTVYLEISVMPEKISHIRHLSFSP